MTTLEKIFQEIEAYETDMEEVGVSALCPGWVKDIIKTHLSSNDGQNKCGECSRRKFYQMGYEDGNKDNDGWIPCSERMPETGEHVLVSFKCSGFIPVIAFLSESKRWLMLQGANGFNDITNAVSAWRPLPEPYKPHMESSDGKCMRGREEFFAGNHEIILSKNRTNKGE